MKPHPGPISPDTRLESLDLLRGVAVLGILIMNSQVFAMIQATYFNPTAPRHRHALVATGRTAFSNYLLQTFVFTTPFDGHGIGLLGRVDRRGQALIVLAPVISPAGLRRYLYGPVEWLWRSLIYGKRQPKRRVRGGEATA